MTVLRRYFLVVTLLLGGCTLHYSPNPATFKLHEIKEFSSTHSIALLNAQPSSDEVLFTKISLHKVYVNLQDWTNIAIAITKRELSARGMKVEDNVPKTLKLSIETAEATLGFFMALCKTTLKVETGDGYVKNYHIENSSPNGQFGRAADGAVMMAVAAMLRDEQIIEYLTK